MINRNVFSQGRRTSMRLEPELWDALEEVCRRERIDAGELIRRAEEHIRVGSRTSAVRAYLVAYFRGRASGAG